MKPSELAQVIEHHVIPTQQPVFIWGAPGIGKSDIVAQVAKKTKHQLIDKRLAQSDPTELKGFPMPDSAKKTMIFFRDDELPKSGKGILFLDEMNHAPQATQNAAFQLILNRGIGDYKLPPGWVVMAAGNRASDRSGVHAMSLPLANRFQHIDLEPDVTEWLDWALANNIDDSIRGYIRYRPNNLTTEKLEAGMRAFPSCRSWAKVDTIVKNKKLSQTTQMQLINGTVGEGVSTEFFGFMQEQKNLPSISQILLTPDKVAVPEKPSTCYAIVTALESHTSPNNIEAVMRYVSRLDKEFEVVYMQALARRGDDYCETQTMTTWLRDNRHVLI